MISTRFVTSYITSVSPLLKPCSKYSLISLPRRLLPLLSTVFITLSPSPPFPQPVLHVSCSQFPTQPVYRLPFIDCSLYLARYDRSFMTLLQLLYCTCLICQLSIKKSSYTILVHCHAQEPWPLCGWLINLIYSCRYSYIRVTCVSSLSYDLFFYLMMAKSRNITIWVSWKYQRSFRMSRIIKMYYGSRSQGKHCCSNEDYSLFHLFWSQHKLNRNWWYHTLRTVDNKVWFV